MSKCNKCDKCKPDHHDSFECSLSLELCREEGRCECCGSVLE